MGFHVRNQPTSLENNHSQSPSLAIAKIALSKFYHAGDISPNFIKKSSSRCEQTADFIKAQDFTHGKHMIVLMVYIDCVVCLSSCGFILAVLSEKVIPHYTKVCNFIDLFLSLHR